MRYFVIANGMHGCLYDNSYVYPITSIKALAEAIRDYWEMVAGEADDELTEAEALDWATQAWHDTGYLPISTDLNEHGSVCVMVSAISAAEARENYPEEFE